MPQQVLDAKVEFYNPATGALRYTLADHLRRVDIQETATDSADDAGFDIAHDFADLSNFVVGDECRVYVKLDTDVALTHVWTGVLDVVRSNRKGLAFAELPLQAQDFVYFALAHTYITDSYVNMTAGEIVRAIVSNYVPSITGTSATVENTSTTVPSISFNGESALSAIRRLAEFANSTFKGDKSKVLYFYEKATKSSGQVVSPSTVIRGSFTIANDFADFGNVVTVIGGTKKQADTTSGNVFSTYASITGIVRKKARVFFSKSRVSRVSIWTSPDTTTDYQDFLASTVGSDGNLYGASTTLRSESISFVSAHILHAAALVKLRLKKVGSPTGTATLRLSTDKDTGGLTSTVDVSTLSTSYGDVSFTFPSDFVFSSGATYYLTLLYNGGDASNRIAWAISSTNVFSGGSRWDYTSAVWTNTSGTDQLFRIETVNTNAGNITVRIQADNAAGTAPVAETDANFDLASASLASTKLTLGGAWTNFDMPNYIGPPGGYCWVIVESDANAQRVGVDGSANLLWQTFFDLPIIVQVSDYASISTYGQRTLQPVTNGQVQTEDEATALALRILAQHKGPVQSGTYEVNEVQTLGQAPVGQTVSATFTADGVAASTGLVIQRRHHLYDAELGTYTLTHDFVSAERFIATEDVIRSMADRLKRLEDATNPLPVLYLVTSLNEAVHVSDALSGVETSISSSAVVDTARVGFSIVA